MKTMFVFGVDWDMTMRSSCQPICIFTSKEAAEKHLENFKKEFEFIDAKIWELDVHDE